VSFPDGSACFYAFPPIYPVITSGFRIKQHKLNNRGRAKQSQEVFRNAEKNGPDLPKNAGDNAAGKKTE